MTAIMHRKRPTWTARQGYWQKGDERRIISQTLTMSCAYCRGRHGWWGADKMVRAERWDHVPDLVTLVRTVDDFTASWETHRVTYHPTEEEIAAARARVPRNPDMSLGAVMVRQDEHPPRAARGQVVWYRGRGWSRGNRMYVDDTYEVEMGPGVTSVGTKEDAWTLVPREQWTARERVLSAMLTWQKPDWLEPGEEPQHGDSIEFSLLMALIGDEAMEALTEWDWPDWSDHWLAVARWVDERVPAGLDSGRSGDGAA